MQWNQNTNTPCRQDVSVCGFNSGNRLITQHINRVVNGTKLPQVSVLVEFERAGCDQGCQRTFVLEAYETSTVDSITARNTSNYRQIDRVAPLILMTLVQYHRIRLGTSRLMKRDSFLLSEMNQHA